MASVYSRPSTVPVIDKLYPIDQAERFMYKKRSKNTTMTQIDLHYEQILNSVK